MRGDAGVVDRVTGLGDDHRAPDLTPPAVLDADDRHLQDAWVFGDDPFDLGGEHVLPAGLVHVLKPPANFDQIYQTLRSLSV